MTLGKFPTLYFVDDPEGHTPVAFTNIFFAEKYAQAIGENACVRELVIVTDDEAPQAIADMRGES